MRTSPQGEGGVLAAKAGGDAQGRGGVSAAKAGGTHEAKVVSLPEGSGKNKAEAVETQGRGSEEQEEQEEQEEEEEEEEEEDEELARVYRW